jgi:hypothetical protein
MPKIPTADLHTPDELLVNATAMFDSGDTKLFRGAILEAITALEEFVHRTVFSSLRKKLDPKLVTWLEMKTRMDFDSRLEILTPVATGLPIDKSSVLWSNYKSAKEIRNKVVHSGRKVTARDVSTVMNTVRNWLSYLSSTVELGTALLDFKRWVENSSALSINNDAQATQLVVQFFQNTKAASAEVEAKVSIGQQLKWADVILDFGHRKVLVETKFVKNGGHVRNVVKNAVSQVDQLRKAASIEQACIIVFLKQPTVGTSEQIEHYHNGEIFAVTIQLH